MSSDPSSLTLPSETNVLSASPLVGPAACPASLRSPSTASSIRSPTIPFDAPLTVSISKVLSDIDALPSPPFSSVVATTGPLTCASPLIERALRSQRRNALRASHDVVAVSSPATVRSHDTLAESEICARIPNSCLLSFTPQRPTSVYDHRISATVHRVTTHVANHPLFTDRVYPPRDFSPLAPWRASRGSREFNFCQSRICIILLVTESMKS